VLLLLTLPAVAAPAAGQGAVPAELPVFREPHGYFELPVPAGWHSLVLEEPGERLYAFTPEDISPDQLRLGVDVVAILTLRVTTVSKEAARTPTADLLRLDLDHRLQGYKQHGVAATGRPGPLFRLAGIDLASASLSQPGYDEFVAVGVQGRLFYALEYQWETRRRDEYRPLLERMAAGLRLFQPTLAGRTQRYAGAGKAFAVTLPEGWSVKERDDGKTTQFYVSREKLTTEQDRFQVGAALTRIRRFSQSVSGRKLTLPRAQAAFWSSRLLEPARVPEQAVFELEAVTVGGREGLYWERSFRSPSSEGYLQELHLVLAKDDTLYDVILEAPVAEFELYREAFRQALQSLELN
jgi:hypothetical protein